MKAIVVEQTGGVDKMLYKDVPIPKAKENTVVVKNHFIGRFLLFKQNVSEALTGSFFLVVRCQLYRHVPSLRPVSLADTVYSRSRRVIGVKAGKIGRGEGRLSD